MVEKWLLQVQELMIVSMKDVTAEALQSYQVSNRTDWMLNWPGQVSWFYLHFTTHPPILLIVYLCIYIFVCIHVSAVKLFVNL